MTRGVFETIAGARDQAFVLGRAVIACAILVLLVPAAASGTAIPELPRTPRSPGPVVDPGSPPTDPVVTMIGDSISVLWGPYLGEELTGIAAVHNTAWSGQTAESWSTSANPEAYPDPFWQLGREGAFGSLAPAPEICTIGFATNEIVQQLVALILEFGITAETLVPKVTRLSPEHPASLESRIEWQRSIAEDCRARGAEVILLRPIGAANGWNRSESNVAVWIGFEFRRMDKLVKKLARDLDVPTVKTQVGASRYWSGSDGFHPNPSGRAVIAKRVAKKVKSLLR